MKNFVAENDPLCSYKGAMKTLGICRGNRCVPIRVEVARTPEQRAYGLMNRMFLPERTGMLFVYPSAGYRSVWMKNTYVPLDVLFLSPLGVVLSIRQAYPHDLTSVGCSVAPSQYIIELPYDTCKRYGIREGDQVVGIY